MDEADDLFALFLVKNHLADSSNDDEYLSFLRLIFSGGILQYILRSDELVKRVLADELTEEQREVLLHNLVQAVIKMYMKANQDVNFYHSQHTLPNMLLKRIN